MFIKYAFVGVANTLIHWCVFFLVVSLSDSQGAGNLLGFLCAVTFSYFVNAKVTFKVSYRYHAYFLYVSVMALISFSVGYTGDYFVLKPIWSLLVFSFISLILGYRCAKYIYTKTSS